MRPATRPHVGGTRPRLFVRPRVTSLRIGPIALPAVAGWLCVATMLALASPGVRIAPIERPEAGRIERPAVAAAESRSAFPAQPAHAGAGRAPGQDTPPAAPEASGAAAPRPAAL